MVGNKLPTKINTIRLRTLEPRYIGSYEKMTTSGLDQYLLKDDEAAMFHAEFKLVLKDINLETIKLNIPELTALKNTHGVYFWMMRLGNSLYKVYVGKTNSLPRRLRDYKNEFQEHAPNDHKLRFFQTFMNERYPGSEFDLYFTVAEEHTQKEKESVRKYCPLINEKTRVSEVDRKVMKDAFAGYYASIFKSKLVKVEGVSENLVRPEPRKVALPHKPSNRKAMSNHDMIATAMKDHRGQILEASEIKKLVLKAFPAFTVGSLLPNDHAFGNKSACNCAGTGKRIFDRVEPRKYLVR